MRSRSRRDLVSATVLALGGVAYLLYGHRYPLDTMATPGPGVFPRAAGLLLVTVALVQLGAAWWRAGRPPPPVDDPPISRETDTAHTRSAPLLLIGLLTAYAAGFAAIGFGATSFLLVVSTSRVFGARGWLGPTALAVGLVGGSYLLFVRWLGVPLPWGLFR